MKSHWYALVLIVAVVAAYANSLDGSFQYDDDHSIVRNASLRQLTNVPRFFVDPALFSADPGKGMYRPLLLTTLAANYAVDGYRTVGYHIANIALHLGCVLVLWRLGTALSGAWAGFAAALLFGLHPLAAEPVNYISSRSELLLGLFYLGTLCAHVVGHRHDRPGLRRLAVLLCVGALLSKATAVTLVPALMLIDLLWLGWRPTGAGDWLRRHGTYALVTAAYLTTILANGFLGNSLRAPVRDATTQLLTQMKAPSYYLRLILIPRPLSVEHAFSEASALSATILLSALLLSTCVWIILRGRHHLPRVVAPLAVGALVLLPTCVMPLNVLVNERRLYVAMAAGVLAIAAVVRFRRVPLALVAVALLMLTIQRNAVWASPVLLWESALASGSGSYRTLMNLGKAYHENGRVEDALRVYERALALDDGQGDVFNNVAVVLHQSGQVAAAVPWYEKALARYPEMDEIYQNLADAYAELGQTERAIQTYRRALSLDPESGGTWNNLGELLMSQRQHAAAESAFVRAVALLPEHHEPYNNLGNARSALGDNEAAVPAYDEALERVGDQLADRAAILANAGESLRRIGDLSAAVQRLDTSIAATPTAAAFDYRARVAHDMEEWASAREDWQRAIDLDPTRGTAWTGLGELAERAGDLEAAVEALRQAAVLGGGTRARLALARNLEHLGRLAEARSAYQEAIQNGGAGDPRLQEARAGLLRLASP